MDASQHDTPPHGTPLPPQALLQRAAALLDELCAQQQRSAESLAELQQILKRLAQHVESANPAVHEPLESIDRTAPTRTMRPLPPDTDSAGAPPAPEPDAELTPPDERDWVAWRRVWTLSRRRAAQFGAPLPTLNEWWQELEAPALFTSRGRAALNARRSIQSTQVNDEVLKRIIDAARAALQSEIQRCVDEVPAVRAAFSLQLALFHAVRNPANALMKDPLLGAAAELANWQADLKDREAWFDEELFSAPCVDAFIKLFDRLTGAQIPDAVILQQRIEEFLAAFDVRRDLKLIVGTPHSDLPKPLREKYVPGEQINWAQSPRVARIIANRWLRTTGGAEKEIARPWYELK